MQTYQGGMHYCGSLAGGRMHGSTNLESGGLRHAAAVELPLPDLVGLQPLAAAPALGQGQNQRAGKVNQKCVTLICDEHQS